MKRDNFLIGILVGIAVLVIVALIVFFMRKDNMVYVNEDTPAGVIQNYIIALHKRDFDKAYTYLADLPYKPSAAAFREAFYNHNIDPTNAGIEIGTTDINGDTAAVNIGVIYNPNDPFSNGYQNSEYAQLVKQNGAWKIKQLPYSFWSFDWYRNSIPVK